MTTRTISFEIECGDETCCSKPGELCKFLGTRRFGSLWVCRLFPADEGHTVLEDVVEGPKKGWIGRCRACMESTE